MRRLATIRHQGKRLWKCSRLLVFLLIFFTAARGQDVQVTATVSTDTVGVQDQFQLTITVSGDNSSQAQIPNLPKMEGLHIVAGPSLSTQFQWVNGKSTSSRSFIYILLPEREGQFSIDPISVAVGNQTYHTQAISVRVTSAPPPSVSPAQKFPPDPLSDDMSGDSRTRPSGEEIFMSADLDRSSAYTGQQVTLVYRLYTQVSVTGLQLQESPPLTGFWVENLDVESKPTGIRKIVNGKEYLEYVVKKQALFANTSGKLTIPASTFAVSVRTSGDIFGFLGQTNTVYRKTREMFLDVIPLPEQDRPEGFSNAVGAFTMTSKADRTTAAVGEAVPWRVKLEGKGNLKEIADLPLPGMPDLTIYSSKSEENLHSVAGDQIGGEKTWEYVIVPKAAGSHTIPSLSFSYFDPERGTYETVSTAPIPLDVTRGSDADSSGSSLSGVNKQLLTRQGTDINFIKLEGEGLETRGGKSYQSPWFYIPAFLALACNAGAFLIQRERNRRSGEPVLMRRRRAKRKAQNRLKTAEKAGRLEPRRFYDEASAALAGYLEDRFNLPGIAVTADMLERTLAEKSVNPVIVKDAVAALQECDFGRFVSASPDPERRQALGRRIRSTIEALEQVDR